MSQRRNRGAIEVPLREAFANSPHVFTTVEASELVHRRPRSNGALFTTSKALRKFCQPMGRSDEWPGRPMLWRSKSTTIGRLKNGRRSRRMGVERLHFG